MTPRQAVWPGREDVDDQSLDRGGRISCRCGRRVGGQSASLVVGPGAILAALGIVGVFGIWIQTRHSILRAFPILGHARVRIAERIRPEIYQYFVESNTDGAPFDRETRDAIYLAKGIKGDEPFGTERNVNEIGYEFLRHSLRARIATDLKPTVRLGGPDCAQPYDIALLNVSAMSFGALSGNAIEAPTAAPRRADSPTTAARARSSVPPQARRRSDLGDRFGLFRLPHTGRPLRSGEVQGEVDTAVGQGDLD